MGLLIKKIALLNSSKILAIIKMVRMLWSNRSLVYLYSIWWHLPSLFLPPDGPHKLVWKFPICGQFLFWKYSPVSVLPKEEGREWEVLRLDWWSLKTHLNQTILLINLLNWYLQRKKKKKFLILKYPTLKQIGWFI